jgi:ADP-ribosylation factor-like protein 8
MSNVFFSSFVPSSLVVGSLVHIASGIEARSCTVDDISHKTVFASLFFSLWLYTTSGKTTLLSVLANGQPLETVPTIGLNVKVFKKGSVNMKCWDIGGQEQYRSEWSRYTRGCDVVLYVIDAAAPSKIETAKKELHKLLDDGSIGSTPLLVLANKIDLPHHIGESELIEQMQLNYVMDTPWMVLPISALQCTNIDQVIEWLTAQGK